MRYFTILSLLLTWSVSSQATLGKKTSNFEKTSKIKIERFSNYEIRENSESQGLTIREFVGQDETVFGVAWVGQYLPEFKDILGEHFTEFEKEAKSSKKRQGPLHIETENLVFFSGGSQRKLSGHAYLKNLIPKEVSNEVIK